jgi:hypothetical protein
MVGSSSILMSRALWIWLLVRDDRSDALDSDPSSSNDLFFFLRERRMIFMM